MKHHVTARPALAFALVALLSLAASLTVPNSALAQAAGAAKAQVTVPPEPDGMMPLFNGKDLSGWDGDPRLWSVKDGLLRGKTTAEIKAPGNTFLIWKGGEVADFDLRLSFRMNTSNNSGIQYRSRHLPFKPTDANKWVVGGYQAEVRNEPGLAGFIYDERGKRGRMCLVGEKAAWTAAGKKLLGSVGDKAAIAATFKTDDWNEYVIVARGNQICHYINGVQTIDFTDEDEANRRLSGIIALQLHAGKPMWVEFRNIRLKRF
jgi:hypothetical protein